MKLFSWLITVPLVIICVLFAVNNRQLVSVDLWPFDYMLSSPLYIMTLGAFFLGFLFGGVWFWMLGLRHRWDKRRLTKEVGKLKTQLTDEKAKSVSVTPT